VAAKAAVPAGIKSALARGRADIDVFSREVLGVDTNLAQKRWFRLINRAIENGWAWVLKLIIHVAANQIGKTLGVAILILWACTYKMGTEPPGPTDAELKDWISKPYTWFHLAPSQQQAYLPLNDINLLIQGAHPAQDRGREAGLTCLWTAGMCQETKVEQYYRGLSFWNGALCQFRTTEEKAKALQGRRAAGISFDEAAFEDHLKSVVNETLMMRLIAHRGPLFLVGTPNGINDYYEIVQSVIEDGEEVEERAWINDGAALAWSVITDNVGFGITAQEVERMERNLDETTKEQQLRGAFLEPSEAFFIPTRDILGAFRRNLPELVSPLPGHRYVIAWDPSLASDPTAGVVIDVTTEPWRGVALLHKKKPLGVTELVQTIWATHLLYNNREDPKGLGQKSQAITAFDATAMGGVAVKQLLAGITPIRPVNFGGPSAKIELLTNLRASLLRGRLILPDSWAAAKRELANYRLKDEKIAQDVVMALAIAADIAARGFTGTGSRRFDVSGRVSQAPVWR
jgi:hypothetical protein